MIKDEIDINIRVNAVLAQDVSFCLASLAHTHESLSIMKQTIEESLREIEHQSQRLKQYWTNYEKPPAYLTDVVEK